MQDKARFIKLLNEAFEKEYNDVFLYLREANLFRKKIVSGERIGNIFESFSLMELRHADRLVSKILELGGKAEWKFISLEVSASLREVLERHVISEAAAVAQYEEILAQCEDEDFKIIIKGIKEQEKEHLAEVSHILRNLKAGRK